MPFSVLINQQSSVYRKHSGSLGFICQLSLNTVVIAVFAGVLFFLHVSFKRPLVSQPVPAGGHRWSVLGSRWKRFTSARVSWEPSLHVFACSAATGCAILSSQKSLTSKSAVYIRSALFLIYQEHLCILCQRVAKTQTGFKQEVLRTLAQSLSPSISLAILH